MEKILKSPAKINLGLWIINKRIDGYHNIFSFMHTIDLYDRIYIKPSAVLRVSSSNPFIKQEDNIVYKTIKLFEDYTDIEVNYDIYIEKNIPVGAGLGGGSSNAATILKFLNKEYSYPLSEEKMIEILSKVGSDTVFFLKGGFSIIEGKGEKVSYLDISFDKDIFIIYPNINVSTKEIYSRVTERDLTKYEELDIIFNLLRDFDKLIDNIQNKLGDIAEELYPQIKEVKNTLNYLGYKAFVTGSGSAVVAIGQPSEKIETICKLKNWKLIKTKLSNTGE